MRVWHRVRHPLRALLVVVATSGVACGRSSAPKPVLTGNWVGAGGGYVMNLSLSQSGQNISGNGSIAGVSRTLNVTAAGTFAHPSFTLTMSGATFTDFDFIGTLDARGHTMTGEMNRSGFDHVPMSLSRQ